MKKNVKRWLALILAVAMVSGTCLAHADGFLAATDGEETQVTQESAQAVADEAGEEEKQAEQPKQEPVEEKQEIVIPKKEAAAEKAADETAPETTAKKAEEVSIGQKVDVIPSEKKEDVYQVVFHRPAVEGGTLRVWTEGSDKKDVTYTQGKYVEEVTEGTTLYFEIESTGNYLVDSIKDQNGTEIAPTNVSGKISSYKMVINENKEFTITYKEAPAETEEDATKQEAEPVKEEKKTEDSKANKNKKPGFSNTLSLDDASTFAITGENTVYVGETITLTDTEGSRLRLDSWESSDESVATVQGKQKSATVTGVAEGKVTITHSWFSGLSQKSNTFTVTVVKRQVGTIKILDGEDEVTAIEMEDGATRQLKAVVTPEGAGKNLKWTSSDVTIVSVDNKGNLTANQPGEATITVDANDGSGKTATVTVKVNAVPVENIAVNADSGKSEIYVGKTLQLTASVFPENASDPSVSWESESPEIATVNENGLVTAIAAGTVEIKAVSVSTDGVVGTYEVTVKEKPEGLIVTQKKSNDEGFSQEVSIDVGTISETIKNVTAPAGYKFAYAKVDNTEIYSIEKSGDTIYVTTAENQLSGIQVDDSREIILYYVPDIAVWNVTYEVTVNDTTIPVNENGTAIDDNGIIHTKIIGVKKINNGENLSFAVAKKDGYTIQSVTANDKTLTASNGTYTVSNVKENMNIVVTLKKEDTNKIIFHGSNTRFGFDGQSFDGSSGDYYVTKDYNVSESLSFTVTGRNEHSEKAKTLNKLVFIFNGGAGESVLIPANKDETTTTTLKNGVVVTVKKLDNKDLPSYQVVATAAAGNEIHGKINIETNFKDRDSYEIWARQLVGVDPLSYYYDSFKSEALDPTQHKFGGRGTDKPAYIYIKVQGGYDEKVAPTVWVTGDGETRNYEVKKLTNSTSVSGAYTARNNGCQWYFEIPKDDKAKDIRISVTAKSSVDKFAAQYDYNGGNDANGSTLPYLDNNGGNGYEAEANYAVSDGKGAVPTKSGYVFTGWKLGDQVYQENSLLTISADHKGDLAKLDDSTGYYTYKFVAQWGKKDELGKTPYEIQILFEDEKGSYSGDPVKLTDYGVAGKTAVIIESQLTKDKIETAAGAQGVTLPKNWYTDYELVPGEDRTVVVKEDGSSVLTLKYQRKGYDFTVKYVDEQGHDIQASTTTKVSWGRTAKAEPAAITGYTLKKAEVKPTDVGNFDGAKKFSATMPRKPVTVTYIYSRDTSGFRLTGYEGVYDGATHTVAFEGTLLSGESLKWYVDGSAVSAQPKSVDVINRKVKVEVQNANGEVVWASEAVDFVITPKKVTITVDSKSKVYGTEDPVFTGKINGLVNEGDLGEVTYARKAEDESAENVGDNIALTASYTKENTNYTVEVIDGKLDITPITDETVVKVTGNTAEKEYNREEQSVTGFTTNAEEIDKTINVALKEGSKAEAKGTNVGHYTMGLTEESFVVTSKNYSNIKVEVVDGYLDITPITAETTVTIKGNQKIETYTGKELKVEGYTSDAASIDGTINVALKEGSKAEAKGTEAGTYQMGLTADSFTVTSDNYSNIKVEVKDGFLKINPADTLTVHVTGNTKSQVYNGKEQKVEGFTTDAPKDVTVELKEGSKAEAKGTNVAEYPMNLKAGDFKATSKNYSKIDVVIKEDGKLTITPITSKLTITANSDNKVYDGKALTNDGFTDNGESVLAEGDIIKAVVKGSQTDAGNSANTIDSYQIVRKVDDKEIDVTNCYSNVEFVEGKLTVTKRPITITAKSDSKKFDNVALTAGYEITDGALVKGQKEDITVKGSQLLVGKSKNIIDSVKIYDGITDVTENYDIKKVEGTLEVTDGTLIDPVDPKNVVTKTHVDGKYGLGDTIEFTIEVTNIYNKAKTITIVEQDGVTITGQSVFADVAPGAVVRTTATYEVTEQDILTGTFTNKVTAKFDGEKDYENTDKVEDLEDPDGHITVVKETTSTPESEQGYALGESITYKITATNDGNITVNNVVVTDELTKGRWNIGSLAPGASYEVTTEYEVTEADIHNGSVVNVATATGRTTDPENPDPEVVPGRTEDETETPVPRMRVDKTMTSTNTVYRVGDTITYQIAVANTGNVTLHDVKVTDTLEDAAGEVTFAEHEGVTFNGNVATIESIEPGKTVTLNCSYVVTRADAGKRIINSAVGDSDETKPTDPSTTTPANVENIYNLTINYVYAAGGTAAPSVRDQYLAGESFIYTSPSIAGYTPNYAFVRTGADGMPARDVVITIIYTANPVTPTTPTTPTPTTPGGGDGTAVTPAPAAAADGTPVGAEVALTEDGDVEVVPVVEEEVPLAKRDLDDHECCILHFLLMLAAMIVYAAYTRSMKKRQEKIAELAEELETEKLKREQQEAAE